jgi:hypothetical protein
MSIEDIAMLWYNSFLRAEGPDYKDQPKREGIVL